MNNPFLKDGDLLLHASLNKLPLRRRGGTAKDRCSSAAIRRKACAFLRAQGITRGEGWQAGLLACLDDPARQEAAHALLARIARDIGEMIWTLKRGEGACTRPDWRQEHWRYWAHIRRFYLAGGLLHGRIGCILADAVREDLARRGLKDTEICLTAHPAVVSLIGAAKYAAAQGEQALVLDFGHSFVKQGWMTRDGDGFALQVRPRVPARWTQWKCGSRQAEQAAARALAGFFEERIEALWQEARRTQGITYRMAVVSVANYVQHGRFVPRGGYGKLRWAAPAFDRYLSRRMTKRLGVPFTVQLLHDGTAGAYGAQDEHWQTAAFIGFGTSLSVGFPCAKMDFPFPCRVIEPGRK